MKLIPLREYQSLTCLSDSIMMELLARGALPCHLGKHNAVLVDVQHPAAHDAVHAVNEIRNSLHESVIEAVVEHTAPIIRSMVDESLRIAVLEAQAKGILSPLATEREID